MNTKTLRISCAQLSFPVGAIQENKDKIINTLKEAEKVHSDIVLFPELALTGYPPEDLLLRESFVGKKFCGNGRDCGVFWKNKWCNRVC